MDIEKLIERLEAWNEQHLSVVCGNGHFACDYLCENEDCVVVRAAAALSTLQAENKKLRAELEQVKAELNAAKSPEVLEAVDELMEFARTRMSTADWLYYVDVLGEWRGQKED